MFVSIHIPKTAGTSLASIFDHGCNRRIWYDYNELKTLKTDLQPRHDEQRTRQETLVPFKPFIKDNFDFIHGHFLYSKYANFFSDAKYITCIREPIKRLVSHYYHLLDEADDNYWLYREIMSGHLDLVDLAKIEFIGDLQSQYIKGCQIEDFDFVFIAEKLPESVYHFQLTFNFKRNDEYMNIDGANSIPHKNIINSKKTNREILTPELIYRANQELHADNELYQRAIAKFISQGRFVQSLRK